jgi:hypothetical protein
MGEDEDHFVDNGLSWHPWAAVKKLRFNLPPRQFAVANLHLNLGFSAPPLLQPTVRQAHDQVKSPHNLAHFRRIFQPFRLIEMLFQACRSAPQWPATW